MYESMAELERDFKKRIAGAEDAAVPGIEREMADAKVEFLSAQIAARELQDARRAAIQKYPAAADWEDELRGETAEQIEAHAAKIHERMAKFQEQRSEDGQQAPPQQQAPEQPDPAVMAYGQPGVGGQGAPAPAPDRERELYHKVIGSGGGKNRNVTGAEAAEYQRMRMARALDLALKNKGVPIGLGGNADRRKVG